VSETDVSVEWQHKVYRLTVIDATNFVAFWQAPGSAVKRDPSQMPRGLRKAWKEAAKANQAATDAPTGP